MAVGSVVSQKRRVLDYFFRTFLPDKARPEPLKVLGLQLLVLPLLAATFDKPNEHNNEVHTPQTNNKHITLSLAYSSLAPFAYPVLLHVVLCLSVFAIRW
jgi:hypothetical protein